MKEDAVSDIRKKEPLLGRCHFCLSHIGAILAVFILSFFVICVSGCARVAEKASYVPHYESPYDWDCLVNKQGRLSYVVNGSVVSKLGIDVSESQGFIDWEQVAHDGIGFAYIRLGYRGITEGKVFLDEYYNYNIEHAIASGLQCGVYFYSQALNAQEAKEEAEFVLQHLKGKSLSYSVAFDYESVNLNGTPSRNSNVGQDQMREIAHAFCERIKSAGYEVVIYGNKQDLRRFPRDLANEYAIWWAEYDSSVPHHDRDIFCWQYTNNGRVAGIDTAVDMNIELPRLKGEIK